MLNLSFKCFHLSDGEMEYLTYVLYNAFYGFEAMTVRDLNDAICGECGIVGKVYYGDGNEKNCCSLNEVSCCLVVELIQNSID